MTKSKSRASLMAPGVEKQLAAYAATAAAVAVGAFEAPEAHASIIYSGPQNIVINPSTSSGLYIDLDGNAAGTSHTTVPGWDFNIFNLAFSGGGHAAMIYHPSVLNQEVGTVVFSGALDAGSIVGPTSVFTAHSIGSNTLPYTYLAYSYPNNTGSFGFWDGGVTDKYLGVEFTTDGTNELYGWIRMSVDVGPTYQMTVTGWAYETSGAAIAAGDVPAVPEASTTAALGLLAVGAVARRPRKIA